MNPTAQDLEALEAANAQYPDHLQLVPRDQWPPCLPPGLTAVWRSRQFLVQMCGLPYCEEARVARLSVCRTTWGEGTWADGISWDDLQRLKRECGCGDMDAVEIYPADRDVVNVANMRHLWLVPRELLPFAWRAPT